MRNLYHDELHHISGGHGHDSHEEHESAHMHNDDFHAEAHSHAACGCRVSVNKDVLPLLKSKDPASIEKAEKILEEHCAL